MLNRFAGFIWGNRPRFDPLLEQSDFSFERFEAAHEEGQRLCRVRIWHLSDLAFTLGRDHVNRAVVLDASETSRPCTLAHGSILPDRLPFVFIVSFVSGPWQANCYVVAAQEPAPGRRQPALVIDPGMAVRAEVDKILARHDFDLQGVVCTHGHVDHVADAAQLANDHRVPLWLHPADLDMLTRPALGLGPGSEVLLYQFLGTTRLPAPDDLRELSDGQRLQVAGVELLVVHAPGHTPGCVVLLADDAGAPVLFSGDVLFAGSIGRVDLPGGSMAQMRRSLRRLRCEIDPAASILSGHGPATTMAHELATNPYLKEEMLA